MKATIIGGGIVGLSTAFYLNEDGWDVTVLERGDFSDGCSFGNMGYLSPSHFVPLAQPGVLSQGFFWLFDVKSPFYVRPELNWALIDWGWRFARACNPRHVARSARAMADLLLLSKHLTAQWQASGDMDFLYESQGCINYFQTTKYEKSELETVRIGRELGLDIELLDRDRAQEIEPELHPDVRGGAWYKDDAHLHPNTLMRALPALLKKRGAKILHNAQVIDLQKENRKISRVTYERDGQRQHINDSDLVVLAAGSWSRPFAQMAGEHLPLMPGKGYSMTVDVAHQPLRYPCILLEAKVALTPWPTRLRIGSTMEIGSVNDRILYPRVQGILEAVPRFFPGYAEDPAFRQLADFEVLRQKLREKVWFGFRPLSADGLPYIGFAKKTSNLMIATGHAMLGLSMAAATGKLLAEMAGGKPTSIATEAFDLRRL